MSYTLAIDPGLDTGWAIVDERGVLIRCGLGDPPVFHLPRVVAKVIIERPQVYAGRMSKGDPNDLITLAIQVGRYTERFQHLACEHVLPRSWKGTVDADVLCRRVYAVLSEAERAILDPVLVPLARAPFCTENLTKGKRHNVIDAVGLGRWSASQRLAARFSLASY
jgi:hypothetical protein